MTKSTLKDESGEDIRRFFGHRFSELIRRRGGSTEQQLGELCKRAEGQFVYAVAMATFIDRKGKHPEEQLDLLLLQPSGDMVLTEKIRPGEQQTICSVYMSILQKQLPFKVREEVRSVLAVVVFSPGPVSPSNVAASLPGYTSDGVVALLRPLNGLVILYEDKNSPIKPIHRSFFTFLKDPNLCTDNTLLCTPPPQIRGWIPVDPLHRPR